MTRETAVPAPAGDCGRRSARHPSRLAARAPQHDGPWGRCAKT